MVQASKLLAELKDKSGGGIDMYFENVGGIHFEASFNALKPRGECETQAMGTLGGPPPLLHGRARIVLMLCHPATLAGRAPCSMGMGVGAGRLP